MTRKLITIVTLALMGAGASVFASDDSQANNPVPQRFRGRVAALSGPVAGATDFLTFHVDRFTTDAEADALGEVLGTEGEEALLKAVSKIKPAGWVRIGTELRYHLRLIQLIDTPQGRMLVGVTDRPLEFGEVVNNTRSRRFTFGWVQIVFDKDGKGEGALIPTARISFNEEDQLVVEAFGTRPYEILKVLPEKLK